MNDLISVIVPIYKVEEYLDSCVISILNQTYTNYELILVDDGSPDNCPKLCDQYGERYSNIRVIHKENGGLSDARNEGVKVAKGDYVTFIDSDDYVHPLYLELLLRAVKKTNAEFSICGFNRTFKRNEINAIKREHISYKKMKAEDALCGVLYQQGHDVSAWGMLLPLNLVERFPFPVGVRLEDMATTYQYYLASNQVVFVNAPLYYYFQRSDSIMKNEDDGILSDWFWVSDNLVKNCQKNKNVNQAAISRRFSEFCVLFNKFKRTHYNCRYPERYQYLIDILNKDKWKALFDKNANWHTKVFAFFCIAGKQGLQFLWKLNNIKTVLLRSRYQDH